MQVEDGRDEYSKITKDEELMRPITHIPDYEWTEGTIPTKNLETVQKTTIKGVGNKDLSGKEDDKKDHNKVAQTEKSNNQRMSYGGQEYKNNI